MKSFRCFEAIVDPLNVWGAWHDFQRGKSRRPEVATFALSAEREVTSLARELATGRWRPGGYRLLRIRDPKRRIVAAAPVRDRVVHHALHRVLAPLLNRRFIDHSYACLPDRGTQRALLHLQAGLRRHRCVLHLDISRYFYDIDRARLRALLFRSLPEEALQALLEVVLECGAGLYTRPAVVDWLGWTAPQPPGRGLPIGNLTSQWWGNLYLDGLDHFVCRTLRPGAYQRYMDDLVLLGDEGDLLSWREEVGAWLLRERGLRLKDPQAHPQPAHEPLLYLGHLVTRQDIALGPKARQRLPGRLARHAQRPERAAAAVQSYGALWMWGA